MSSDEIYWALKYFRLPTQKHSETNPTSLSDSRKSYEEVINEIEEEKSSQESGSVTTPPLLPNSTRLSVNDESLVKEFFELCDKGVDDKVTYVLQNVDRPLDLLCKMDKYGWTPLMCACASGSLSTVKVLMDFGASVTLNHEDAGHNSALSIAKKFNFLDIFEVLDPPAKVEESDPPPSESISFETNKNEAYDNGFCEVCNLWYKNYNHHHLSISHLYNFAVKNGDQANPRQLPEFGISRSNVGYKMMQAAGWDSSHGLGVCKTGRLYPIRPKIKDNRTGLGSKNHNMKHVEKSKIYEKRRKKPFTEEEIKGFRSSFR